MKNPYCSAEWMREIAKKRQYKNQARGERSGRCKVPLWKRKMICAYDKMPRDLAESIGRAANITARHVYQIRKTFNERGD